MEEKSAVLLLIFVQLACEGKMPKSLLQSFLIFGRTLVEVGDPAECLAFWRSYQQIRIFIYDMSPCPIAIGPRVEYMYPGLKQDQ